MASVSVCQTPFQLSHIQAVAAVLANRYEKDLIVQLFHRVKKAGYLSEDVTV